jgi:hypothetical protein
MEMPANVLELIENLQRQVKELQTAGAPTEAARIREEQLEEMRRESRFQGLGKGAKNPNEHAYRKYPGWRFHLSGAERLVERPDQEPAGLGSEWFATMAEYQAALEAAKQRPAETSADVIALPSDPEPALAAPKVDGRSKAAREKKKHGADA